MLNLKEKQKEKQTKNNNHNPVMPPLALTTTDISVCPARLFNEFIYT